MKVAGGCAAGPMKGRIRMTGKLVICPTPIGNLGDMPPRALEALRAADIVCAEDTRVTGKLLSAFDVEGKRLERLDENVVGARAGAIVARVQQGETIVYCTDAGMPGVSDPGLRLVRAAREAAVPVEVLPGPTAAATAYVASGCLDSAFYFGGFFPRKDAARKNLLAGLSGLKAALIFYESPNRLVDSLECIKDTLPHRCCAVCRELTKLHEEVVRGPVDEVHRTFAGRDTVKGEIVIVIDGPSAEEGLEQEEQSAEKARLRAAGLLEEGLRPKDVARRIAEEFSVPRNRAYEIALEMKR